MTNYLDLFTKLRAPLEQVPLGPYAFLCLAIWAAGYLVRRYRPKWWRVITLHSASDVIQGIPAVLLGAAFAGGTTLKVEEAAFGVLCGLGAIALHHALKALPIPYRGAVRDVVMRWLEKRRKSLGMLVLLVVGCAPGREACYARNDAAFQEVVDDCDDAGFTYEACPWLPEAERVQEARDGQCP